MSATPALRRTDRQMPDAAIRELLARAFSCRVATVGADGFPYIVPLLFVWMDDRVYVHNSAAPGHFQANVRRNPRVCVQIDEPVEVFAYGRFECDTGLAYRSAIGFGTIAIAEDRDEKTRFCAALMQKYGGHIPARPKSFFPRLDHITVYAMTLETLTGKECPLPASAEQWPALDRTKTPQAKPPGG